MGELTSSGCAADRANYSTREQILAAIRSTAEANGGKPLGVRAFEQVTGIRYAEWFGRYWKSWGDAVAEAGFTPNTLTGRIADAELLTKLAALTRELHRVPVNGDMLLKRTDDRGFPNAKAFARLGSKVVRTERLRAFCKMHEEWADVLALLPAAASAPSVTPTTHAQADGVVYLVRLGRYHKVGRTNAIGRREYELNLQLPERVEVVHTITTDDAEGIEAYWHRRFAAKRTNGEWFTLDARDIAAFKRRKFQ